MNWVITEVKCPKCKERFPVDDFRDDYWSHEELNTCPNCGIKLQIPKYKEPKEGDEK